MIPLFQRPWMRVRAAALLVAVLALARVAGGAEPVSCALIVSPAGDETLSQAAALVQARVGGGQGIRWIERHAIDQVLREHELQAMLSPKGVSERTQFGRLVGADLLIICRRGATEDEPTQLVVCEARHGLRLSAGEAPADLDAKAVADELAARAAAALEKHRQGVREIYAVPPFVSQDLTFEFEHLKTAYARLIEQRLLGRDGAIVVELAEAEALSHEAALAARDVRRSLPLYLLGEFRNDGRGDARRQRASLLLKRGAAQLGKREQADLYPRNVPQFLGRAVDELLATADLKPIAADARVEAKTLAGRGDVFRRVGNWCEAAALYEASLLLAPQQVDVRRNVIVVLGEITSREPPVRGERTRENVERRSAPFFRGLEHVEEFLRVEGDLSKYEVKGQGDFIENFLHAGGWNMSGHPHEIPAEWRAALEECTRRETEALLRIVRIRQQAGHADGRRFMIYIPRQVDGRYVETINKLHLELADPVPPRPPVTAPPAAAALAPFDVVEEIRRRENRPPPVQEAGPPQVTFKKSDIPMMNCLPAGKGTDMFWNREGLFIAKDLDQRALVYKHRDPNDRFQSICFDGHFVWAPLLRYKNPEPLVLVVDPSTARVGEITTADGLLPMTGRIESSTGSGELKAAAAPVRAGRVLLCGAMGNTWIATADFEPGKGATIRVFHEARDAADRDDQEQWRNIHAAFDPMFAFTLTDPKTGRKKVLLGRASMNVSVMSHPLLIDAESLAIAPVADEMPWFGHRYTNHDGALYWAHPRIGRTGEDADAQLWRLGFPRFRRELLAEHVSTGPAERFAVGILQDRLIVVSDRVFSARTASGPFRPLRGALPEYQPYLEPRFIHSALHGTLLKLDKGAYELTFPGAATTQDTGANH